MPIIFLNSFTFVTEFRLRIRPAEPHQLARDPNPDRAERHFGSMIIKRDPTSTETIEWLNRIHASFHGFRKFSKISQESDLANPANLDFPFSETSWNSETYLSNPSRAMSTFPEHEKHTEHIWKIYRDIVPLFCWNFEVWAVQNYENLVDPEEAEKKVFAFENQRRHNSRFRKLVRPDRPTEIWCPNVQKHFDYP